MIEGYPIFMGGCGSNSYPTTPATTERKPIGFTADFAKHPKMRKATVRTTKSKAMRRGS